MGKMHLDVVVVGSLHLDIVVEAQALPKLDETARGSSWRMVCGGKGGNQACWAARLGARTAMLSQVGDDDFGRRLLDNLRACHVDESGVHIDAESGSGMSVAILNSEGEYGAVIVSGANLAMQQARVHKWLAERGAPRIVVMQNEIEDAINVEAAAYARQHGATIILNAAPARPLPAALQGLIDVLVVNRVEAEMMSGRAVASERQAAEAVPALQALAPNILITLGGGGVVLAESGSEPRWLRPVPVKPVSTHGAGDCFVGQLAAALAQGQSLQQAAVLANATAARFVGGELLT